MSETHGGAMIYSLRVSGRKLANPVDDIRGRTVMDRECQKMGFVDDLLLDATDGHIRFIQIAHGGLLGISRNHFLMPVNAITKVDEQYVHIDRTRHDVERKSVYSPQLVEGQDTGGQGWWEKGPDGAPGVPIQ